MIYWACNANLTARGVLARPAQKLFTLKNMGFELKKVAERERFELSVTCATTVFETVTLNRSDTSPHGAHCRNGALGENRTPDALLRTEALYPLSYEGNCISRQKNLEVARSKGFEPPT